MIFAVPVFALVLLLSGLAIAHVIGAGAALGGVVADHPVPWLSMICLAVAAMPLPPCPWHLPSGCLIRAPAF